MADLPDTLTDAHDHPGLFQLVQGTLAGLRAFGKYRRQFHDGKSDKQNPIAVLDSICQSSFLLVWIDNGAVDDNRPEALLTSVLTFPTQFVIAPAPLIAEKATI